MVVAVAVVAAVAGEEVVELLVAVAGVDEGAAVVDEEVVVAIVSHGARRSYRTLFSHHARTTQPGIAHTAPVANFNTF